MTARITPAIRSTIVTGNRRREAVHDRRAARIGAAQHHEQRHERTKPEGKAGHMDEDARPRQPLRFRRAGMAARGQRKPDLDQAVPERARSPAPFHLEESQASTRAATATAADIP